jgi:hypothetical protein
LQDDNQKDADNEKDAKKKEVIFQIIIKDGFYDTPINETAEASDHLDRTAFVYRVGSKNQKKPLVLSSKVDCYF